MVRLNNKWENLILLCILGFGAVFLFYHAEHYFLWGDEGVTAVHGKNVLKYGLPYGFDGRNFLEFRNGIFLNAALLPTYDPWGQYYISALSQQIFGTNTFGARALFIAFGFAAILTQFLFVRSYFKDRQLAIINVFLMVTSITFVLFSRQGRYYPLGMFLGPLIAYAYSRFSNRRIEIFLVTVLFILFFFTNSLIGFAVIAAMGISFFLFDERKKALYFYLAPIPFVVLSIGIFLLWLYQYGVPANPHIFQNIHPIDFGRIFLLYIRDYNETQLLPYGALFLLLFMWLKDGIAKRVEFIKTKRQEISVIAIVFFTTLLIAILSPQSSDAAHSDIRYATPIFSFLLLIQALVIRHFFSWKKWAGSLLFAIVIGTNLLTFTPFRSYLLDYIQENLQPFDNSVKAAVLFLEKRVAQDDIVLVSPNHMLGSVLFYLGDRMLFCNVVSEDNRHVLERQVALPQYIYSGAVVPKWVVLFGLRSDLPHTKNQLNKLPRKDYRMHRLPIFGPDVSRPELFWRSFSPVTGYPDALGLYILERIR
ncbi:MAG TPA: glycosyltransferase family 39 protein [Syntrophales bacterium]|nr:glycosyltransferase family 39 protein [Syntrophales bacterium]